MSYEMDDFKLADFCTRSLCNVKISVKSLGPETFSLNYNGITKFNAI